MFFFIRCDEIFLSCLKLKVLFGFLVMLLKLSRTAVRYLAKSTLSPYYPNGFKTKQEINIMAESVNNTCKFYLFNMQSLLFTLFLSVASQHEFYTLNLWTHLVKGCFFSCSSCLVFWIFSYLTVRVKRWQEICDMQQRSQLKSLKLVIGFQSGLYTEGLFESLIL